MTEDLSWIPFYEELVQRLLACRNEGASLVRLANSCRHLLKREQGAMRYEDMDPLTFLMMLHRNMSVESRRGMLGQVKEALGLASAVPTGFAGVPFVASSFLDGFVERQDGVANPADFEASWRFFESVLSGQVDAEGFNRLLTREKGCLRRLVTFVLYWAQPRRFLPLSWRVQEWLRRQYRIQSDIGDYEAYRRLMEEIRQRMEAGLVPERSFVELSIRSAEFREANLSDNYHGVCRPKLGMSVDEWVELLTLPGVPREGLEAVLKFYREPGRTTLFREFAAQNGMDEKVLYERLRLFGAFIQKHMKRCSVRGTNRGRLFWLLPFEEVRWSLGLGDSVTLCRELAEAIGRLGLAESKEGE